jgi:uncharacterized membrane protein YdjX (TVP38/TMEM64 family)
MRTGKHMKFFSIVCIGVTLGLLALLGHLILATSFSLPTLMFLVQKMSWTGVFLYVVCAAVGVAFFVPSTPLAVAGGLIFAPWLGLLALQTSSLVAACMIFAIVRIVQPLAGNGLQALLPAKIYAKVPDNAILLIVYARTFMVPDPAVNYGAASLPISFRDYFIGTFLGSLPRNLALIIMCNVAREAILDKNLSAILQWELIPAILIAFSGICLAPFLKRLPADN